MARTRTGQQAQEASREQTPAGETDHGAEQLSSTDGDAGARSTSDASQMSTRGIAKAIRKFNHEKIATWAAIVTIMINSIALVATTRFNSLSVRALQEQIRIQQDDLAQARPVDFVVDASIGDDAELSVLITNLGDAAVVEVNAQLRFYFLFPDGGILSSMGVTTLLSDSVQLLRAAQESGLLVAPDDVPYLLGPSRLFYLRHLGGVAPSGPTDAFRPELSQSAMLNSLRLATVLKAKAILGWRFDYQHQISRQRFDASLYLMLVPRSDSTVPFVQPIEVSDLGRQIGGPAVINAIREHEASSLEEIFPAGRSVVVR